MAWTCTVASEASLRSLAKAKFESLANQWLTYSNYWRLGHSLDTILDYFNFVDGTGAAAFAQTAFDAYDRSPGSACWYDDFAWWGIASLKAKQSAKLFDAGVRQKFMKICFDCWSMYEPASMVWANNSGDSKFAELKPRFDGGVWNHGWTGDNECGGPNKPPTPPSQCVDNEQGDNLDGIQNTVTNGLYLVLAWRLYQYIGEQTYSDAGTNEFNFLQNWFSVPEPQNNLLLDVGSGSSLARERVATYASGQRVCGYEPDLCWSGDQGIMVGGLVDRWIANSFGGSPLNATAILSGVSSVTNKSNNGVVQPWTNGDGGDPGDYATGIGVFMRYLLYVDQRLPDIRKVTRSAAYVTLLNANVQAVINDTVPDSEGDELTRLTNRLAILVAAIVLLNN